MEYPFWRLLERIHPVDQGAFMKTKKIEANPFFSKKEHQLEFSVEALKWLLIQLEAEKS